METGSYGTSDFASTLSGSNGLAVAHEFVAYVGPPGQQNNVVNPPGEATNALSPNGGYASHLYVYSGKDETEVTVSDLDTSRSIFNLTFSVPADGYYDVVIDQAAYTSLNSAGHRPYLHIDAEKPVVVVSGNFNDNWMTHFNSIQPAQPEVTISIDNSALACDQASTLSIVCGNELDNTLPDVTISADVPEGTTVVAASGMTSSDDGRVMWAAEPLASGAQLIQTLTIQRNCTAIPCSDSALSAVVVECGSNSGTDNYHRVSTFPVALENQSQTAVTVFSATDIPDYDSSEPNAHVRVFITASSVEPGSFLTLTRAIDNGDVDAAQTTLASFMLSPTPQSFEFDDSYPVHYEQTRYYRLETSSSGCAQTLGPVAVQTSSGASGGEESGLESHGGLAEQMARRAIMRARRDGSAEQQVIRVASRLTDEGPLAHLVPGIGPMHSAPVNSTPGDLPALTNARRVTAVDYLTVEGLQVASMLVVETRGEVYEHQKALCDRAHGSRIDAVRSVAEPEGNLLQMASSHDEAQTGEYSIDFKLYREANGYILHSSWLRGDYPIPIPNQEVLNVQVWSMYPGLELSLLSQVLQPLTVRWGKQGAPPAGYFAHGSTGFGELELQLFLDLESTDQLSLRTTRTTEQKESVTQTISLESTFDIDRKLELSLDRFLDITVELVDESGHVIDNLWLSDGAWTTLSDNVLDGRSELHDTSFDCPLPSGPESQVGAKLSGCGSIHGQVDDWISLVRHLSSGARDGRIAQSAAFSFELNSTSPTRVCLESPLRREASCVGVDSTDGVSMDVRVPTSALRQLGDCSSSELADIELVSFTTSSPGPQHLSVRKLTFYDDLGETAFPAQLEQIPCNAPSAPPLDRAATWGCRVTSGTHPQYRSPVLWALFALAGLRIFVGRKYSQR